ncbi:MAG: glycosyltransferase family 4 protein [bacterium]
MKRVGMLFSCSFQPYQGRYRRVYLEAQSLLDAGYGVTIFAWDRDSKYPEEETRDGIRIRRYRRGSRFTGTSGPIVNLHHHAAFDQWLVRSLAHEPLDVIHCFNLDTIVPGLLVSKVRRKKAVLDLCEPDYYFNWPAAFAPVRAATQVLERVASPLFDCVTVHNLYQLRKFRAFRVRRLEQIASVPDSWVSQATVEKKHTPGAEVTIGRVGTIFENNGIEELLDAFARLRRTHPRVKLLLAGKVLDSFRTTFERCVAPVRDACEVTGEFDTSQLPDLYRRLDFSISLNRRESVYRNITPTKFFDSLAYGVPIISSDIGDLRSLNERYPCALLVDETSPESILAAMSALADHAEARRGLALNGIRLIQEEYNWGLMSKRLVEAYERLLSRPGGD